MYTFRVSNSNLIFSSCFRILNLVSIFILLQTVTIFVITSKYDSFPHGEESYKYWFCFLFLGLCLFLFMLFFLVLMGKELGKLPYFVMVFCLDYKFYFV